MTNPHFQVTRAAKALLIAGTLAIGLAFAFPRHLIATGSMAPTIEPGTVVWASRTSYLFGEPKRGDIVVFRPTAEVSPHTPWAHRIVALPGDRVEIKDRQLFVNGSPAPHPHINAEDRPPMVVPEGYYLQKGDHPDSISGLVRSDLVRSKIVRF